MSDLPSRSPCFDNLVKVLRREVPARPVLFEIAPRVMDAKPFMEDRWLSDEEPLGGERNYMNASARLGYDYSIVPAWNYRLSVSHGSSRGRERTTHAHTVGMFGGGVIVDERSLDEYMWPELMEDGYARLAEIGPWVPEGMKLVARGPGVHEALVELVGYEQLCIMSLENPALLQRIAAKVGERSVRHFELMMQHEFIGAILPTDDWGFKTQLLLPPETVRSAVVPWHRRIVEVAHRAGRPAVLHSCGQLSSVVDDIIDTIGYDGKHSFEDAILPVEDAYEQWSDRIAILGGIDVDYLSREEPGKVHVRSKKMLGRSRARGGYALGSGNSIPDYVPTENYLAMNLAALEG